MSVRDQMLAKLSSLAPVSLTVIDESHRHAGHVHHPGGAGQQGETHFQVEIVSPRFQGLNRVARQRLVYELLADELKNGVHALGLTTLAPDEAKG